METASFSFQGLYSEVSGPTLPYLKERSDSNFEQISRALVARSVGFLSGAVAGGFLCDQFYHLTDLWMALSLFLAAIAVTAAPWCTMLALLSAMFFLDGVGKGILASGICCHQVIKFWFTDTKIQNLDFGLNQAVPLEFGTPISKKLCQLFLDPTFICSSNFGTVRGSLKIVCSQKNFHIM